MRLRTRTDARAYGGDQRGGCPVTVGVTITPTTLAVTEGGEQTYTVVLDTEPAGTVAVAVTPGSGATAPITVTPSFPSVLIRPPGLLPKP